MFIYQNIALKQCKLMNAIIIKICIEIIPTSTYTLTGTKSTSNIEASLEKLIFMELVLGWVSWKIRIYGIGLGLVFGLIFFGKYDSWHWSWVMSLFSLLFLLTHIIIFSGKLWLLLRLFFLRYNEIYDSDSFLCLSTYCTSVVLREEIRFNKIHFLIMTSSSAPFETCLTTTICCFQRKTTQSNHP